MKHSQTVSISVGSLQRRIGLRSAVAFNMLEMIGVGPFIALPLVIAAAGVRLSVWASGKTAVTRPEKVSPG